MAALSSNSWGADSGDSVHGVIRILFIMFKPFKISSDEIDLVLADGTADKNFSGLYEELSKSLRTTLSNDVIKQTLIDGTRLQEKWFPQNIGHFDVFISHSHLDLTKVKQFSYWLNKNLGLRCFVDSVFWKYSNKLIEKLDEGYCRYYDRTAKKYLYRYSKRNITTANVHCMLTMALMKMMDSCEMVVFVDSDNSIKYDFDSKKTPSPWIYEEIEMANMLPSRLTRSSVKNSKLDYLNESELKMFSKGVESCTFMYDAKLKGFSELTADILQGAKGKNRQQYPIATDSLDTIYRLVKQVQGERFFL